jgi:flagellar hook-associated protein 3 FlgL
MVDRIASFIQTTNIVSNNLRLQSLYGQINQQIASGVKSETFPGIAEDSKRLLNLESDYERILQQTDNISIVSNRVNIMFDAVGSIVEQTQKFMGDLSATVSTFGPQGADLVNIAQTNLRQVAGQLNTLIAGRYLFSGSDTQTQPVDLNDPAFGGQTYTAPGPSVPDTDYYQGNNYIQTVEASDGFNVDYGVTANNAAFEQIIRAYDLIITAPNDQDTLAEAFRLLQLGADEAAVLQANISQEAQVLEQQESANQEELVLLEEQIVDIREVDLAGATVQLSQIEAQLEASFSATSRLLRLSIVDFIR